MLRRRLDFYYGSVAPTPPPSSLLTGLISYWPLQTNSNDIVGSNDGTDTNITYSSAAVFNGTSKIAFADTPEINDVQQFTISGKIKVTSLTTTNDFFSKWFYPTAGSWFIRCYEDGLNRGLYSRCY